jgi:hypothetical protein
MEGIIYWNSMIHSGVIGAHPLNHHSHYLNLTHDKNNALEEVLIRKPESISFLKLGS